LRLTNSTDPGKYIIFNIGGKRAFNPYVGPEYDGYNNNALRYIDTVVEITDSDISQSTIPGVSTVNGFFSGTIGTTFSLSLSGEDPLWQGPTGPQGPYGSPEGSTGPQGYAGLLGPGPESPTGAEGPQGDDGQTPSTTYTYYSGYGTLTIAGSSGGPIAPAPIVSTMPLTLHAKSNNVSNPNSTTILFPNSYDQYRIILSSKTSTTGISGCSMAQIIVRYSSDGSTWTNIESMYVNLPQISSTADNVYRIDTLGTQYRAYVPRTDGRYLSFVLQQPIPFDYPYPINGYVIPPITIDYDVAITSYLSQN
jgi:hypothetical protein